MPPHEVPLYKSTHKAAGILERHDSADSPIYHVVINHLGICSPEGLVEYIFEGRPSKLLAPVIPYAAISLDHEDRKGSAPGAVGPQASNDPAWNYNSGR